MKPKLDNDGNLVLRDGNPVFELGDGKEAAFVPSAKLDETKKWAEQLQNKLGELEKRFEGVDPDRFRELDAGAKADREKELLDEKRYQELLQRKDEDHALTINGKNQEIERLQSNIHRLLVGNELSQAAARVGAFDPEDVRLRLNKYLTVEEHNGQLRVMVHDGEGRKRLSTKGDPLTAEELVGELREKSPHLFKPSGGSGGGSPAGGASGGMVALTQEQMKDPNIYRQHREAFAEGRVRIT